MMKIATCQYAIDTLEWDDYAHKIETWVRDAAQQHVNLLLMPEYAGVEMGGAHTSDAELFSALQPLLPRYLAFFQALAKQSKMYIQPGTLLVDAGNGQYHNRAYFFSPQGDYHYQDKLQLVAYERSQQSLALNEQQTVFDTAFGKVAIAVCYDSEFPEIIRQLVNAGAWLILVPSYTNTSASYHRVMLSARARAIENQCYIAVSYAVGTVTFGSDREKTLGQAAVFGPADVGFPDDGIIVQGNPEEISMVVADISAQKISQVRRHGMVRNFEDTKRCQAILQNAVTTVTL